MKRPAMSFRLGLAQIAVVGGDAPRNLERAEAAIATAAARGIDVVLLPETLDLGWTHPAARVGAAPIPDGLACRRLRDAASRYGVFVCAGLTERAGDRVYNAAVLVDRHGDVLIHHRKVNELPIGRDCYGQGDRLSVAHTELGTLGIMICADATACDQAISRTLGCMGADVILSPCAWVVDATHDNRVTPYGDTWRSAYIPVARAYSVWIAGCSNVGQMTAGPWAGKQCIGCSLVIGPQGREIVQGPYGVEAEALIEVTIDPVPRASGLSAAPAHAATTRQDPWAR